ncbi:MAG: hypothetical protein FWH36_05685 [Lentimicrobiaceae bacterium]|nr:hypothetical protein [Lentimicrobiaceae bacterium]
MPAGNERFTFGATSWWRNGGSNSAESSVEAATTPSRWDVARNGETKVSKATN